MVADGFGEIDEGDETNNVSIKTLEIVNLKGWIISDTTGDGIYDVTVTISPDDMIATTPPNGYYSFKNLPAGEYTIKANKQGYTFNSVTCSVSDDATTTAPKIIGSIDRSILNAEIVQAPKIEDLCSSYVVGDRVPITYTVKNTGDVKHTFYAGYSVRDPCNEFWDAPYEAITLNPGEVKEITLQWVVQNDAPAGSYDVVIAVWATQQLSYLYDNLDQKEDYEYVFNVISGDTSVPGWYLSVYRPRKVLVEGVLYTAIPAFSQGKKSWLILNKDNEVEPDLETYKHAAEAAAVSSWMYPGINNDLREIQNNFNTFADFSLLGKFVLWIRDTGSWLLGKFGLMAVTGGGSLATDVPAGAAVKVATKEIAKETVNKLRNDLTELPKSRLTEEKIKKILWGMAVLEVKNAAGELDNAIEVIENHEESEPWSYQEAHFYYTKYSGAAMKGTFNMNLTTELQPGCDLGSQILGVTKKAIEGASGDLIKFDEIMALEMVEAINDLGAMKNAAIVLVKYAKMFDLIFRRYILKTNLFS